MIRLLKEIYGLVYSELMQTADIQAPLSAELERIKEPLRGRGDFEELDEICLEVSCSSQEFGFIKGFKYGIAFMVECMEGPGQE